MENRVNTLDPNKIERRCIITQALVKVAVLGIAFLAIIMMAI